MGLENFILTCEKDNKSLRKDIDYYKNYNKRLNKKNQQLKKQLELSEKARKEGIELIKDSSLEVNTREYGNLTVVNSDDLLKILDIDKGDE